MLSTAPVVSSALLATGLLASLACSSPEVTQQQYGVVDGRGRKCTHAKFGITATCENATPAPSPSCRAGSHACFVIYVPKADGGESSLPASTMWNCDACCSDATTIKWDGNTGNCAPVVCKTDDDCVSEDGACRDGQCRSQR